METAGEHVEVWRREQPDRDDKERWYGGRRKRRSTGSDTARRCSGCAILPYWEYIYLNLKGSVAQRYRSPDGQKGGGSDHVKVNFC